MADEQSLQKLGLLILAEEDKGQLDSSLCGECLVTELNTPQ